jgi:hypothetical protein
MLAAPAAVTPAVPTFVGTVQAAQAQALAVDTSACGRTHPAGYRWTYPDHQRQAVVLLSGPDLLHEGGQRRLEPLPSGSARSASAVTRLAVAAALAAGTREQPPGSGAVAGGALAVALASLAHAGCFLPGEVV